LEVSVGRYATATASLVIAVTLGVCGEAAAAVQNGAIAFSGKGAGTRVLYARPWTGGPLSVLRTDGRADHPAFSPGGRRLAFTRYTSRGAQVFVTYVDGAGLFQLTSGPRDSMPTWSPEGDAIAFTRGARGLRDVYRITTDGTHLKRLTRRATDDYSPAWSPAHRIAFVRRDRRGEDLYSISPRGGPVSRLTRSAEDEGSPSWSPTGRRLVFVRGRPGRRDLFLVSADGSHTRRLTRVRGDEIEPAWSPDGKRIVFTHRRSGRQAVYLMKPTGAPVRRLPSRGLRVRRLTSSRSASRSPAWQPAGLDPVVAAAGDIACDPESPSFNAGNGVPGACRQRLTSDLLFRWDLSRILALGDLQYEDGQLWKFQQSFDLSWGRLKSLISPVPGNHEYVDPGAAGYFDYFNGPGVATGPAGERGKGYYSFDLGAWHLVALNSECSEIGGCGAGSPQIRWLEADLAAHPAPCTLAFWHRPRFDSGEQAPKTPMLPAWNALYQANADLILNGHDHVYERFAPQTPAGVADPARGIRQITIGSGGRNHNSFVTAAPNSEVRDEVTLGVLRLTLGQGGYEWRLSSAGNVHVVDAGAGACH
jgi:Tol biopolymer transport system component